MRCAKARRPRRRGNRCYLDTDPDPAKNPIGRNAALLAQLVTTWSTLVYDTANRNELLNDQLEIYRRGVAGEARPACCPAPFDVDNNWMHEFPTAYVIPVGEGQRSNPEANRLVDWLLFNGIEVRQLRFDSVILGQDVEEGSYVVDMAQAHRGLAETALGIGVDISARIGILYAPPAAWSHGYLWGADVLQVPNGVPFTAKTTQPIAKPVVLGGGVESGPAEYYLLELDSPTAVRTLNMLLKGGLTAKLATAPFTSGGVSFPAGTVLFDDATAGVIGLAAQSAGLTLRRVATAPPQLEDIDSSPRIAVFANAVDQSVWSLRDLGFTADPVGTTALNGASDPLVTYDVVFSTANYPANTPANATARARLAAFFAAGGGYIGGGANGAAFITNGGLATGLTANARQRAQRHRLLGQHGRRREPDHRRVPDQGHGHRRPADLVHGRSVRLVDRRQPADRGLLRRGALADRRRVGVGAWGADDRARHEHDGRDSPADRVRVQPALPRGPRARVARSRAAAYWVDAG